MNTGEPEGLALKRVGHAAAIQALLDEAQAKLPLDVLADLRNKVARLVQDALQDGREKRFADGEMWWINSHRKEPWAGLRMAHFGRTVDGMVYFFIVGETDPDRIGMRFWEEVSEREGWRKVERIPTPVLLGE